MADRAPLRLFEAYGIELEYMLVDTAGSVLPATDELLRRVAGSKVSEVDTGEISWSNELVLHVVEFKTSRPAPDLARLPEAFQESVSRANAVLRELGGRLLPTAMHPWMDPASETRLWPHEHRRIYETFHRIFDCRGHGWSNLQSLHINLPFADAAEFGRLHAAVRLLLPILPALAASSPVVDGSPTGLLDNRLEFYRTNCARIPSVTGEVIPEAVFDPEEYRRSILERMYRDIAPHDPDGVLMEEFLNARGAIARLERRSIEIRVLDVQECPLADLAVAAAVTAVLRALVGERWTSTAEQQSWEVPPLARVFRGAVRDAEETVIEDERYLALFGVRSRRSRAGTLWESVLGELFSEGLLDPVWKEPLEVILARGPLARRILSALGKSPSRRELETVYRGLADCLASGELFR